VNIQTDRALAPADRESTRYLTVTITAPDPGRRPERAALNVAFVIDRSGSMAGRKFEMAAKAVDQAIRLLDDRDRLALVCYDHEVNTLLAAAPASSEAKALAIDRLKALDARGQTDLCGGWMKGAEQLAAGSEARGAEGAVPLSRVLLLSDGLANHGETDPQVLAQKAAELRAANIATSTFGVGADFDEVFMSRLATEGGGHFYFIERAQQIPDFLASELGDALQVVARDARVVIARGSAHVELLGGFSVETHQDELHVRLGDLVAGQVVTVVLAVRLPAQPIGSDASVVLRLVDRDRALFPQPMSVDWRVTDAAADAAQPVNVEVLIDVAKQLAERGRTAALAANRRGGFEEAAGILKKAAAAIRALGPDIRQIEAIAAGLDEQTEDFEVAMAPLAMKQAYFQSHAALTSRDSQGRSRKSR